MIRGPERGMPKGIHLTDLDLRNFATTQKTGRPVAERAADEDLSRLLEFRGIHVDSVPTKYTDSRKGTLMNAASLEAFRGGETQQLLDSFAWIREKYFVARFETPERITDDHLLDLANLGEALPSYLMLRGESPIDRRNLPEVVGNLFKASVGFRNVARKNIFYNKRQTYESAREVFGIANNTGLLNRTEMEGFSCAANEQLITKSADALLFGNGADPAKSILSTYLPDEEFDSFTDFSIYNAQYRDELMAVQMGVVPRRAFYEDMANLQRYINVSLGRDHEDLPPPHPTDLDYLLVSKIVVPSGSLMDDARKEVKEEIAIWEARSKPFRLPPLERRTRKGKRKKK